MSEVKHELRRHQDDDGLTHWVIWDDSDRFWFPLCNVWHAVPGKAGDDHTSPHEFVTCVRCMNRRQHVMFSMTERVGIGVFNPKAIAKIAFDFNPE